MKTIVAVIFCFFCFFCLALAAPHAQAQICTETCSAGTLTLQGVAEQCQAPTGTGAVINFLYPAGGTATYLGQFYGTNPHTLVWSGSMPQTVPMVPDTAPGQDGQCYIIFADGPSQVCPGIWETQVVEVVDPDNNSDFFQFYVRGYGATAQIKSAACVKANPLNFFGQNFQQMPAICCACTVPPCPLVADLLDRGFAMTDVEKGVEFDFFGNGHPLRMAWTDPSHGNSWLVRPEDGDVVSGRQMFGNAAPQPPCPDGGNKCFNGWRALAIYDLKQNGGNGNGVIDPGDAVWKELRFWRDSNQNGKVDKGELYTLDELGIKEINLQYASKDSYVDVYGNKFTDKGSYGVSPMWDVWPRAIDAQGHLLVESETDPIPQTVPDCVSK